MPNLLKHKTYKSFYKLFLLDSVEVLTDIYKLNQYIQQGREDRIPDKIERLTRSGVRLRVDNGMRQSEDEMLTYVFIYF